MTRMPHHDQVSAYAAAPVHPSRQTLGTIYLCAVAGVSLTSAPAPDQRGWGPACDTSKLVTVTLTSGVHFSQRAELAELTTLMMNADIRDGYAYRQADTGAYNCRVIAGTSVQSWHSWPVAIDKNWNTNPQRSPVTTDYPTWLLQRWNRYGWRWGGNYSAPTVPDAMHHEFMGTPAQAAAATSLARSELGSGGGGGSTPPALPAWPLPAGNFYGSGTAAGCHNGANTADQPAIRGIQQHLIHGGWVSGVAASSWSTSSWVDGLFGSATAAAVSSYQHALYPGTLYWGDVYPGDYNAIGGF